MNVTCSSGHVSQISSLIFAALPSRRETKKTLREEQKKLKIEQKNLKLEEKNKAVLKRQQLKHPLLPSCQCRKSQIVKGGKERAASFSKKASCLVNIPEERRVELHGQFWSLFRDARLAWVDKHMEFFTRKNSRKSKIKQKTGQNRKTPSRKYFLPEEYGTNVEVCKVFFFRTLGYANENFTKPLLKDTPSSGIRLQLSKQDNRNPVNKMSARVCDPYKKDEHHDRSEPTCSVTSEEWRTHVEGVEITRQLSQKNCKNHVELASHSESAPGGIFSVNCYLVK